MSKNELQGWVPAPRLANLCLTCKYVLRQGRHITSNEMAACEFGNDAFPAARRCHDAEPQEMDE